MADARVHSAQAYLSLKAAFRCLVKQAGGQQSAASITRVDHQRIGRYGRVHEDMQAPLDVVADLESDIGEPVVTVILADLSGYILVPKPSALEHTIWASRLGSLAKESGEAIAKLGQAFGDDGTITGDESRKLNLRQEVREAMEALASIDQTLKILEDGE